MIINRILKTFKSELLLAYMLAILGLTLFTFSFQKIQNTNDLIFDISFVLIGLSGFYVITRLPALYKRKLTESEEKIHLLSSVAKEGILIHNQGIALEVNDALTKIIGYTKEEIIGKNLISSFVHPEDRSIVFEKMEMANSEPYEVRAVKKDGTVITIELHSYSTQYVEKTYRIVSVMDITERNRIEDRLRASQENFQNFFSTIDDMIFIADRQGKVFYINDTVTRKLGYTFNEIFNMNVLDVHPVNKRTEAEQIFSEMFAGKRDFCPLPLERKGGLLIPVETRVWFGKWDGKDCIFGISKDLSKEQEILQKFNKMFINNPALMAISNLDDKKFTEVNIAFLNTLGYTADEIIGNTATGLNLFVNPELQKHISIELLKLGRIQNQELELKTKSGEILHGLFSGEIIESQGKTYILTVMINITERKRIEERLNNKRQRLQSIISGTRIGTWEWNVQTGETIFNDRWAQMIGYTLEELEPISVKTWESLTHPDDFKKAAELLTRHFKGEIPYYNIDCRMKHKDGRWIWMQDSGQVISWTDDGKPLMMFGTHMDITNRKKLEEQIRDYASVLEKTNIDLSNSKNMLEESLNDKNKLVEELLKAKEDLERTNYEKDKFFSIIAHDLRSPFQSFIGLTEVVADNINDFTLQELSGYINEINSKANNLFKLLKNLLEWAKAQRGILTFDPKRINLRRLIEFNIESIKPIAEKKTIELINNITDDLIIFADENMAASAISNLLTNAVKFTRHNGQVIFSANKLTDSIVEITISDTGIGMPEKILNNLFKLTEKVGRLGTNGEESTGLGLLLCKDFIEKHDGKIRAESIEGKGSKFIFTLPLMPAEIILS